MAAARGSVTRTTFAVRSSQARGGRTTSPWKSEKPDGTSTRRACCAGGIAAFARYMRIDEPIVRVSQYSVTFVRISSFVKRRSMSPSQSLHARSFSTIHAASPAGESVRPKAAVWGFVRCTAAYAPSAAPHAAASASQVRSSGARSAGSPV